MIGALSLFALGLVLILAEILLPSFGLLSLLATLACLGSVLLAFREDQSTGFWFLGALALFVPLIALLGLKLFPRTPMGKHMLADGLSFDSSPTSDPRDLELTGKCGRVESKCRPAGQARIEGRRVDVVTRGEWIEKDEEICVIEVSGNRVVVARSTQAMDDGTVETPDIQ